MKDPIWRVEVLLRKRNLGQDIMDKQELAWKGDGWWESLSTNI